MLHEILKQLGFGDKEIAVYLCVLERGKVSVAAIARATKVKRTTVYSVTKELLSKGLITEELGGISRYFTALPPEDLRHIYLAEEVELKKKKDAVEEAIAELALLPKSKGYSVPKMRFVDEIHLNDFLHKQLAVWMESVKKYDDPNIYGFQDTSLLLAFPEWIEFFWSTIPKEFTMRMFKNKRPEEDEAAQKYGSEHRQVGYWDKSGEFSATHIIIGDYVIFIMSHERPYYLVEIHDVVIARNMHQIFKGIWQEAVK